MQVMLAWAAIIAAAAAVEGRTGVGRRQLLGEFAALMHISQQLH